MKILIFSSLAAIGLAGLTGCASNDTLPSSTTTTTTTEESSASMPTPNTPANTTRNRIDGNA